jgi:hypothetical protein
MSDFIDSPSPIWSTLWINVIRNNVDWNEVCLPGG